MSRPSLDEQIEEVTRELGLRVRLYPNWVKDGKIMQPTADRRLEALRGVINSLQRLQRLEER